MKRLIPALVLAAALAGCSTIKNIETVFQLGTASIANPVTKDRLYQMESAVTIVFSGLEAWKEACAKGDINANCKSQIAAVQVYTRQIPPYLAQLRTFVKTNDQVNATVVFNNITNLVGTVKSQAANSGVNIGS
jgi:hypothetical protein